MLFLGLFRLPRRLWKSIPFPSRKKARIRTDPCALVRALSVALFRVEVYDQTCKLQLVMLSEFALKNLAI